MAAGNRKLDKRHLAQVEQIIISCHSPNQMERIRGRLAGIKFKERYGFEYTCRAADEVERRREAKRKGSKARKP